MNEFIKSLGKVAITVNGEWDITKAYDKLSMVSVTSDTTVQATYISKVDVPANTEITNEEYWFNLIPSMDATFTQINSDWNAVSGVAQILNKPVIPTSVVQYISQSLSDSEKEIARTNIGAIRTTEYLKPSGSVITLTKCEGNKYYICSETDKLDRLTQLTKLTVSANVVGNEPTFIVFSINGSGFMLTMPGDTFYAGESPDFSRAIAGDKYIMTIFNNIVKIEKLV